jgi:hypothetical protein
MSLKSRLRRLERGEGTERCPECHLKPKVNYVFYLGKGEYPPEPEYRPSCNRPLGFVIEVVYDQEGEEDGR